jgi:hypothetical protein
MPHAPYFGRGRCAGSVTEVAKPALHVVPDRQTDDTGLAEPKHLREENRPVKIGPRCPADRGDQRQRPQVTSKLAVTALLLAVLTSACSGGGAVKDQASSAKPGPSSASSPTPSQAAAGPPSPADVKLAGALVHVGDLPPGFTRDKITRGTTLGVSSSDSPCAKRFAALNTLRTVGALATTATARSSFSRGTGGTFIRATARRYRSTIAAAEVMRAIATMFRECPSFTATNPRSKRLATVTLTPLTFPQLGDERVAVAGRIVSDGRGVDINLVFVRTRAFLAYVAQITSEAADAAALERPVRAEVHRLATAT